LGSPLACLLHPSGHRYSESSLRKGPEHIRLRLVLKSSRFRQEQAMVNAQTLQGHWEEVKGKLREKWGQLTGDDLERFSGDVDKLVGLIQRKTGVARSAIEEY